MSNRRIVYHVTSEYMKKNKRRTFTAFLGIVFMVMLMTCVFVGKDTAVSYLQDVASQKDGKWHASLYDIDSEQYLQVKQLDYIEDTAVSVDYGYTEFDSANSERPFIQIKAYSKQCFDWMNIELAEGRFPESANEIVVSESAIADGASLEIGDTISAECFQRMIVNIGDSDKTTTFPYFGLSLTGNEPLEVPQGFPYYGENDSFEELHVENGMSGSYEIVGFIQAPGYENSYAAAYSAITLFDESLGLPENFNVSIMLDLKKARTYYADLRDIVGDDGELAINDYILAFTADSDNSTVNGIVNMMTVFFVVLIMAASVILVYNVFNMSFEERSRYLGMLSSVGATGKQKRSSVYYEAFSLLVVALPVGFATGLAVVKLGMMALKPYIDKMMGYLIVSEIDKVHLEISVIGVLTTMALCIATVAISAFLPARKITRIGAIECIRGNEKVKQKNYGINKGAIKRFGAEGMLACNALKREKKKTRGMTGAIAVFIIILIVTVFSTNTLTQLIDNMLCGNYDVTYNVDSDYIISDIYGDEDDAEYEMLAEEIYKDDSVESVFEWEDAMFAGTVPLDAYSTEYWEAHRNVMMQYGVSDEEYETAFGDWEAMNISILAVDDKTMEELIQVTDTDKELMNNSEIHPVIVVQSGEVSTINWMYEDRTADYKFYEIEQMTDLQIGEILPVKYYSDGDILEMPMTVAGYATNEQLEDYVEFHTEQMWIITTLDTAHDINKLVNGDAEDEGNMFVSNLLVKLKNQDSGLAKYLDEVSYKEDSAIHVVRDPQQSTLDLAGAINSIIRIMLVCFVLLTSVICLLNLYNSIRGRIVGKKKEFAVLRSVGMTKHQIHKMLLLETGGIMAKGVLISALVSTPLVFVVKHKLVQLYGFVKLSFPWMTYVIAFLIAAVFVTMITLGCYHAEKTENILEDIRAESV